jgi:hypothetical protein
MDPDPVCQEHPFCQLCRTLKMAPVQSFSAAARSHELAPTSAKRTAVVGARGVRCRWGWCRDWGAACVSETEAARTTCISEVCSNHVFGGETARENDTVPFVR